MEERPLRLSDDESGTFRRLEADLDAMTWLHRVGALFLSQSASLEPVLVEIVDAAIAICGADFGNIQLIDPASSDLKILAQRGFPDWWLDFWENVSAGKGSCGTAVERGERVIVEDVEKSPIFVGTPGLQIQLRAGVRAVVSTPVVSRSGKPLGMFSAHYRTPRRPDERALRLLDLLAQQTADIIDRWQMECELERRVEERTAELRLSEARYRRIVETTHDGVVMTDTEGRFTFVSERFARMAGYEDSRELVGTSSFDLMDDEGRAPARTDDEGDGRGAAETGEIRFKRRDGTPLWVAYASSRVVDEKGAWAGTLKMLADITERKRMQTQVVLADRMASVGTLAAGVAHEINNPLAYISANLDMIAEEVRATAACAAPLRARDLEMMVNDARQGAERVRKIVRGLHTLSRADEERRVPLDVRAVLELSINIAFTEIKHRARLVKDYGETRAVMADETRLGQVFINLLVNAAHALPEGQADRNEIRLVTGIDSSGRVFVEVRDTGSGIPAAAIGRIFDPFFTTKEIGKGTGLGLSICRSIVAGFGGEITVESIEGRGSIFRVALPAAGPPSARPQARPTVTSHPPLPRAGRVLVIDDDPMIGTTLARVLKEHAVTVVTDGRQSLDVLRGGQQFDVILCDLMMPRMTGIELYEELMRTMPQAAERMVFVTAGAFTPTARAFLDAVPNQRLDKPFAPQNLRAVVRGFVR